MSLAYRSAADAQDTLQALQGGAGTLGITTFLRAMSWAPPIPEDGSQGASISLAESVAWLANAGVLVVVVGPSDSAMMHGAVRQGAREGRSLTELVAYHVLIHCNLTAVQPSVPTHCRTAMTTPTAAAPPDYVQVTVLAERGAYTFHGTADTFGTAPLFNCAKFHTYGTLCQIGGVMRLPAVLVPATTAQKVFDMMQPAPDTPDTVPTVYNYFKTRSDMTYIASIIERNQQLNGALLQTFNASMPGSMLAPNDKAWSTYLQARGLDADVFGVSEEACTLVLALWYPVVVSSTSASATGLQFPGVAARYLALVMLGNTTLVTPVLGVYKPYMISYLGIPDHCIAKFVAEDVDNVVGKAYVHVMDRVLDPAQAHHLE